MDLAWYYWLILFAICFHLAVSFIEKKSLSAPGKFININGRQTHFYTIGYGKTTVILDHSLGGFTDLKQVSRVLAIVNFSVFDN